LARLQALGGALAALLVASLATGRTTAQDVPTTTATPTIVVQNLAPLARRDGIAAVVSFAPGTVRDLPSLHVADTPTAWQPFGMRWPDGSLRQALCLFVRELGVLAEAKVPLVAGPGPALPEGPVPMPAATIEVVATVGGVAVRAEPVRIADLEANALRRVELRHARLGDTGLLAELHVIAWRDQPHAYVELAVWCSDPRTTALQCAVDELAVETRGMALVLRHAGRLGVTQTPTADGSRCVLLQKNLLGDGQGLRRLGVLVPALRGDQGLGDSTLQAAVVVPPLAATSWSHSGAFGPYGVVPPPPPWLPERAFRNWLAQRHRAFVAGDKPGGDPFAAGPMGMARIAGQTGDQNDFGVVKLSPVAHSGLPSLLLEAEASLLQEACRAVHFFEVDGSPVEPANHPDWVVWAGRTHWHPSVSPDRLGKTDAKAPHETHGWTGKDREHWCSQTMAAFALLTGAHWARAELANEARLYLGGQTTKPGWSTSNAGAPRGGGRTALTAAWIALINDDAALRQRMDERMDRVYFEQWAGRTLPADRVRPMAINDPDGRLLQGSCRYWNPWQDAMAAVGFGAQHRVTGNQKARELAEALAQNVVQHGWLLDERDTQVGMAIRWLDGAPLAPEQWRSTDPTLLAWSYGTAYSEWAFGAVEIARVAATARGEQVLAQKCAEIQRRMRQDRRPPREGGPDRFGEWDAVQWQPAGK
jgi:hypothetical protein